MNINAGISSYNLNLKKNKEEKRPTFATIFDKLDARSKKLNSKNPLNAVLTNEQQYRYYLQETEPMLHNNDDTFDLDDVVGNKSLKDMKLSEFAKLLSGNLENDVSNRYETLQAIVSSPASAPLVPSSITISSAVAAPAPVVPPPATPAAPPSGSSGTGTAPPAAPPAAAPPPSGGGGGSGTAPAAAPAAAPSAAPAGSGLSVAIPPAGSGGGSTPTGSTAGGVISGIASAASGLLSSAKSLLSSPKPPTGGPSGTSVPTSAVASAATTAPATGVPTATPVTGAATPAGGGSGTGTAAAGGVSPSAVASSLASGDEGNYNIWFGGTITGTNQLTYNNALKAGLSPPKVPDDITTTFSSTNLKWVNHIKAMNDYNELLQRENKDPTGEFSFSFTGTQENLIKALKANGNDAQVVFEGIKDKSIKLKDYETPKPPVSKPAGGGGAKSGKGGKKNKK